MKNVTLRIEQMSDYTMILAALETVADSFYNQAVDKRILAEKLAQHGIVVVGYIDDALAGVIGYYVNDMITKTAFLSVLVIRKEFQNCGIGSVLLTHFLNDAKRRGMQSSKLEVDICNEKAKAFYRRKGFCLAGTTENHSCYYERKLISRESGKKEQ